MKLETLQGERGNFEGEVKHHSDPKCRRLVAYGMIHIGESNEIIPVQGIIVKSLDTAKYIRAKRGPRGNRKKFIGIINSNTENKLTSNS